MSLFGFGKKGKETAAAVAASTPREDPFLLGRREAEDRYGHQVRQTAQWRNCAMLLVVCLLVVLCGYTAFALQPRVVPYVVEVDKHGYAIAVRPAEQSSSTNQRVVIATIGRFISNAKTVLADSQAERRLIEEVYAVIPQNSPALVYTNRYFEANNPFTIANAHQTVAVEVRSVLPLDADGKVWRGEWTERKSEKGNEIEVRNWTGVFTVAVSPTRDVQSVIKNPLGIYITEYSFSQNLD